MTKIKRRVFMFQKITNFFVSLVQKYLPDAFLFAVFLTIATLILGVAFTQDFDLTATYLAMNINKSVAAKYMRCDWKTIMRCISRTRLYLEPNLKERYEGLVNIGIDETSYRKGHKYVTVVVNHDTNTVVWVGLGHSTQTLSEFFETLKIGRAHV